ncbi:interferon alpha-inducible protein 27-like protein 2B [Amblyraja radiata]|uniref:interferon alpha-inducible protein 27-like protein 2B n=1 Tax=Amblyraja radiata TaxID=386614 RepID=UPI001402C239|nr:interferon alpha-inducible protein 27-like protein 2B [Amblyraja radiata]
MLHLVYTVLLLSAAFNTGSSLPSVEIECSTVAWIAGGAVTAVVAAPLVVGALGFTAAGISAGSAAATMMSWFGGATAAGGVVATLQAVGVIGLTASAKVVVASTGAGVAYLAKSVFRESSDEHCVIKLNG